MIPIGGKQVDLVLGLSMTSADVRWVLVEGTTAEGATICRDAADFDTLDDVLAAVEENRLHAVGVTWAERGRYRRVDPARRTGGPGHGQRHHGVGAGSRRVAGDWASPIAAATATSPCASSIPTTPVVTLVGPDGVTTERVDPTADDMLALLDRSDARPEAIFVLGSADDLDSIAASFHGAAVPVITAAEADLALARGAALASARAVNTLDMRPPGGACLRESGR